MGKADVKRLQEEWFLAAVSEWNADRNAETMREVVEAWRTWRHR